MSGMDWPKAKAKESKKALPPKSINESILLKY